ncbi:hypothetical protein CQA40_02660 [Helicobacter sp. MIT 01-3238]|nr:hypothetical protein CQA40_02660 [Helicobacter sp. MIT 01-3238]
MVHSFVVVFTKQPHCQTPQKSQKYKIPLPYQIHLAKSTPNLHKSAQKSPKISLKNNQKMLKFACIVLLEVKPNKGLHNATSYRCFLSFGFVSFTLAN